MGFKMDKYSARKRVKQFLFYILLAVALTSCGGGGGSDDDDDDDTEAPSAPQNVQLNIDNESITISWASSDRATSYNIHFNTSGGVTTSSSMLEDVSSPYTQ